MSILLAAAAIRLVSYLELRDGPLLFLHHWSESDMAFFDSWARDVAAGDWLTDRRMRPYHSGHAAVAADAWSLMGGSGPVSREAADRLWDRWLGEKAFYQDALYPYLLAVTYRTLGRNIQTIVLLQSVAGLACVLLVTWLGARLFDRRVGLLAGGLAAVYGPLVFYEAILVRAVLVTVTGLVAVAAFVRALEPASSWRRWMWAGFATGVAVLARSTALAFGVLAVVVVARASSAAAPRRLALVLAGLLTALLPLAARNLAVGVSPWTFASTGAWTFLNHNAEDFAPLRGDTVSRHAARILVQTDGALAPVVAATLQTHPGASSVARQLLDKARALTTWFEIPNNASFDYYRVQAPVGRGLLRFGLVGPLLLTGLVLGARGGPAGRGVLGAWLAAGAVSALAFYSISRLRLPIAVAGLPYAAFGALEVARRARAWARARSDRSRIRELAGAVAGLAVAALVVHAPLPGDVPLTRIADVGVANEITLARAREAARAGDLPRALAVIERQLRTEPVDLAHLDPATGAARLTPADASAAGSFEALHAEAGRVCRQLGRTLDADRHAEHARLLSVVAAAHKRRFGGTTP